MKHREMTAVLAGCRAAFVIVAVTGASCAGRSTGSDGAASSRETGTFDTTQARDKLADWSDGARRDLRADRSDGPRPDADGGKKCDPQCHWDCFGGGTVCWSGGVFAYVSGARPCCSHGDPWPGKGPACTSDYPIYSCAGQGCATGLDPRYAACLHSNEPLGDFDANHHRHLLELYCSSTRYSKPGDPCGHDDDCRPAADPGVRLTCDLETFKCAAAPKPTAPNFFGAPCGLAKSDLPTMSVDSAYAGKTCPLCHAFWDWKKSCLKQACTIPCKFDEDCPQGSVCVCVGGAYDVANQVCAKATDRSTIDGRTAALPCLPASSDAGPADAGSPGPG